MDFRPTLRRRSVRGRPRTSVPRRCTCRNGAAGAEPADDIGRFFVRFQR